MSLYGGIDLHANNSVAVLLNDRDQVIYQKRLPNALSTMLEAFAPYSSEIEGFVVGSTYNWYWLVDGLMEAGYQVCLAHPAAIQQYSGLKYTNDHSASITASATFGHSASPDNVTVCISWHCNEP